MASVETIFSRSGVYFHPTDASARLSGEICLMRQGRAGEVRLVWAPSAPLDDHAVVEPIRVPLDRVASVGRYVPSTGHPYITISLKDGRALTPFFFHEGGVREFVSYIAEYAPLSRSSDDVNVFVLGAAVSTADTTIGDVIESSTNALRDVSWNILERFSRISVLVSETAGALFGEGGDQSMVSDPDAIAAEQMAMAAVQEDPDGAKTFGPLRGETAVPTTAPRAAPVSAADFAAMCDADGRIADPAALRARVFLGGVEPDVRPAVWKLLLGHHAFDATHAERAAVDERRRSEYAVIKAQWSTISADQESRFSKFRDRRQGVEKDVVRTDRGHPYFSGDDNPHLKDMADILLTFVFYNFDLGYVQGMSDLLAPIMVVINDPALAFWCFVGLMNRVEKNFHRDQIGIHAQLAALAALIGLVDPQLWEYFQQRDCLNLFFCFRWILILFKREFPFAQIMRLHEALWSDHLTDQWHLFVGLSIVLRYRKAILDDGLDFDETLRFMNGLSMKIDLEDTLTRAEALQSRLAARYPRELAAIILMAKPQRAGPPRDEDDNAPGA